MDSERIRKAVLNPRSVGNLRAVDKELKRLRTMSRRGEETEKSVAALERFRAWYVARLPKA